MFRAMARSCRASTARRSIWALPGTLDYNASLSFQLVTQATASSTALGLNVSSQLDIRADGYDQNPANNHAEHATQLRGADLTIGLSAVAPSNDGLSNR